MSMSCYKHQQTAREQGFYFMADRKVCRYEAFGHQKWATEAAAREEGEQAVKNGYCESFEVLRVEMSTVR